MIFSILSETAWLTGSEIYFETITISQTQGLTTGKDVVSIIFGIIWSIFFCEVATFKIFIGSIGTIWKSTFSPQICESSNF